MAAVHNGVFKLIGRHPEKAPLGSPVFIYCYLSPQMSAVGLKIRWFKETDCVCLYQNGKVTEGRGYERRVSLITHELERGNVSLLLRECWECDIGHYLCQVTRGDKTEELTARVWWRPLRGFFGLFKGGTVPRVSIEQWCRKWTEEERLKMEDSALLTEDKTDVNSLKKELQEKQNLLEISEEQFKNMKLESERAEEALQSKSSQLQMMVVILEQLKTELAEKTKRLEEKERLLTERDKQVESKDKLLEEKNKQLQESTDSSAAIRRSSNEQELPPTIGESPGAASPVSVPGAELRLVLLGRSGCGKSAVGNIILGRDEKIQAGGSTECQQSESRQGKVAERKVTVVDTPDWFCPELSLEKLRQDVGHCVHLSAPGPHAFLLVVPVKPSAGEEGGLEKMEEIFGERCWRNTMILFTATDEAQEKNIEEFVRSGNQEVQRLVEKCGNRFRCLNIKEHGEGSQISELLEKIEEMVEGNERLFYSSETYLETGLEEKIKRKEEKKKAREDEEMKAREEEEMKAREEEEMKEMIEKVVQDSLSKIEGVIEEHEEDVRQLIRQITELERKTEEEMDEKKKRELERQLKQDLQKRAKMENIIHSLKEMREREKREMEEKPNVEMEITEMCEEVVMEPESNHMQTNQPELQENIVLTLKMQEEFSRQMKEKDRELEALKQRLLDSEEAQRQEKKVNKNKNSGKESSGSSKKILLQS